MVHTFRKYISNRGSALFMVVSTMTALMICCMAMYVSVVSSRSSQYAVFNQQQSYQSAVSISEALLASLKGTDANATAMRNIITSLNVGDSISTKDNGFAAFSPTGSGLMDESQLGSYVVTITRLPDIGGTPTYDLMVTSSVEGVKEVFHLNFSAAPQDSPDSPPGPTQVFAATGYVPNDVFLDGGRFITDLFFDNEKTIIMGYPEMGLDLWCNVTASGSLEYNVKNRSLQNDYNVPLTWTVRGDYINNSAGGFNFNKSASGNRYGTVYIGGDCYFNYLNGFSNAVVYILGDLYAFGGVDTSSTTYIVNGNVYLAPNFSGHASNIYTNGSNIYLVDPSSTRDNLIPVTTWVSINGVSTQASQIPATKTCADAVADGYLSIDEMVEKIEQKTKSTNFYKWIVKMSDIVGVRGTSVEPLKIEFSTDYTNPVATQVLKWTPTSQGAIIGDITCNVGNNSFNNVTLIIDTGDDEDNVYTIQVTGNRDLDNNPATGIGGKEAFMWHPQNTVMNTNSWDPNYGTYNISPSSVSMNILVKGKGSVVIDIPKGITYQDESFTKFMHYSWFVLGGGTEEVKYPGIGDEENPYKGTVFKPGGLDSGGVDLKFAGFIHTSCKDGDGCDYSEGTSSNVCQSCGNTTTSIICDEHGNVGDYCPDCEPWRADHHELCTSRLDKKAIDTYLASHSAEKTRMMDGGSEVIYPNTNIFLVSCDESADIRLSMKPDGSTIIQNNFFGMIYAPYMTFKAFGANQGGGMIRLLGGLTVSDYVLQDSMSMLACWPDKMPTELMSDESLQNQLEGVVNKNWKITLNAH